MAGLHTHFADQCEGQWPKSMHPLNQTVCFFYEETAHQSHSFVSNHALRFLPNTDPMLYPQIRYPNEKW